MKILILCNYANGLYLFRKEILEAFLEKGYETVVAVPPDENCGKIGDLGVRLIHTAFERRGNNPIHDGKLFLRYLRLLKEEKPDVVLTYTIKPNLYGGLACRIRKVPYLINITGLGTALEQPGLLGSILLIFYRIAAKKASCVFFQNEGNRNFMLEKKVGLKKDRLLPGSGVNLKEHPFVPYPPEDEGIIFLAVLRIMKDKGIEEYLEAAQKITEEYPNAQFYLVGEYEEETRARYEPMLEELSAKEIIRYFGHIDNVPEVMAGSHVIVHPSYHEGLSNVLLEAAACGRAVLASDVPGCRETLKQGESGFLFAPKDAESLVKAIRTILGLTKEQRKEMGVMGRRHVEGIFDRNKVIEAYFEEIQKAVNK
ncbi:MAG: glycosyltransferase family 4 protein [Lachnospiraceae bacterium]|nr:glycosyltransferase family 4 protein [Lachnospiraceae bacterium]